MEGQYPRCFTLHGIHRGIDRFGFAIPAYLFEMPGGILQCDRTAVRCATGQRMRGFRRAVQVVAGQRERDRLQALGYILL